MLLWRSSTSWTELCDLSFQGRRLTCVCLKLVKSQKWQLTITLKRNSPPLFIENRFWRIKLASWLKNCNRSLVFYPNPKALVFDQVPLCNILFQTEKRNDGIKHLLGNCTKCNFSNRLLEYLHFHKVCNCY